MALNILRRGVVGVAAIVLVLLAAVALIETGVVLGSRGDPATVVQRAAAVPAAPAGASGGATADAGAADAGAAAADAADPVLATEFDALLAADQTAASTTASGQPLRGVGLRRLAVLRHLVHGTVVVDLPRLGGLTTVQLDHGTVSAVSATSLTVAEQGSSSATVTVGGDTRVRKDGKRAAVGDLATGDEVFVLSKVEADGTVAYLVVVPAK
jgi:Domain of unknown function (DUF5666)